jgi:SNF2 family DNA or RNA helicase
MSAIKIEVRNSHYLKEEKQSMFISFSFDMKTVEQVKSLPVRRYVSNTREWEVPALELNNVLQLFSDKEVTLTAPSVKTKVSKKKKADPTKKEEKVVTFKNLRSDSFNFKTTPFEHQKQAFEYALSHDKFLLGDEQGLGKTKQAIDIAVNRKQTAKFKHTLIVCGVNSVKYNWLKEVQIHSNEQARVLGSRVNTKGKLKDGSVKDRLEDLNSDLKEFFIITNVETLRNKEISEKLKEMTVKGIIGMTIIDEIHKCKNAQSQQGKAIHNLKSSFKLALTGTPLMNKPVDLFNILKWLGAEKSSFYAFRNRYCEMGGYGGHEIVGYKNLKELKDRLNKNMLRRKKVEVLNLPPKVRSTEYVEMTAKQAQLYRDVMRGIKANIQEIALSPNPLAQLIRLRQATAHTSILSNTVSESAKLDRLKEMLEELADSGQKAVIFSNWTDVTDVLVKELKEYNPAIITGHTSDRMAEVEKFQNDDNCKVIIGTIGAMGTGLTLTKASTVVFMDKPWNMANTEQAEDRAHRIGTTGTVNIVTLVCKDTIDERIEEIIEEKAEMSKALVEGDEDALAKLDDPKQYIERLLS